MPDSRKGEMIVLMTEPASAELDGLPEHFRSNGLTELSVPRRIVKVKQLPLLGAGKVDYVNVRLMVLRQDEITTNN